MALHEIDDLRATQCLLFPDKESWDLFGRKVEKELVEMREE